jgi:hypothetical protein
MFVTNIDMVGFFVLKLPASLKTSWNLRNHVDSTSGSVGTVLNLASTFNISKDCILLTVGNNTLQEQSMVPVK